jgi:predicted methyltransferase
MRTLPVFAVPVFAAMIMSAASAPAQDTVPGMTLIVATKAPTRTPANVARDQYRHPAETLAFFGVKPTDTVVEIWPGGGWYTEILGPYLAGKGVLYVAAASEKGQAGIKAKQAAEPESYHTVKYAIFPDGAGAAAVPAGTADVVLTFRNVHNWRFDDGDKTQAAFDQMFAMLKPGGTLGVEEHRLPEDQVGVEAGKSGYMKTSSVIAYATKAGFKLAGESAVNANPKDTHDYPKGVWTLPPTYEEGDVDRARYAAIGESDRMTLKFVKPQ